MIVDVYIRHVRVSKIRRSAARRGGGSEAHRVAHRTVRQATLYGLPATFTALL